jgi:hypothetical protein
MMIEDIFKLHQKIARFVRMQNDEEFANIFIELFIDS